jgi:hypothetical protein
MALYVEAGEVSYGGVLSVGLGEAEVFAEI